MSPTHDKDADIQSMLSGHRLATEQWEKAWKDVRREEFTRADWLDLHETIEAFKARVVARHRRTEPVAPPGADLRAALEKLIKKWRASRAHTYASENADLYRGFDTGCGRCADELAALLDAPPPDKEKP